MTNSESHWKHFPRTFVSQKVIATPEHVQSLHYLFSLRYTLPMWVTALPYWVKRMKSLAPQQRLSYLLSIPAKMQLKFVSSQSDLKIGTQFG